MMHLIYYDHRGNGRSGRPPAETLTFQNFCVDADTLRQHLGFAKIAVMGSSLGGIIALEYAVRYPERLSHLILLDTTPHFNYGGEVLTNAKRKGATQEMIDALSGPDPTTDADMARYMRVIAPLYVRDFDVERFEHLISQTVWSASALARNEPLLHEFNATPYLGEIHAPTLIIVGDDDFITPPSQAKIMHAGIPNSELTIIEQAGHFSHVERPDAVVGAIRKWLSRVT
jgi:proline iminopeptidase